VAEPEAVTDGVNDGLAEADGVVVAVVDAEDVVEIDNELVEVGVLLAVGVGRGESSDSGCDAARVTPRKS